jgi:hypothetical protein
MPNLSRSYHQAMESVKKIAKSVIGPLASRIDDARAITVGVDAWFLTRVTVLSPTYDTADKKCSNVA